MKNLKNLNRQEMKNVLGAGLRECVPPFQGTCPGGLRLCGGCCKRAC